MGRAVITVLDSVGIGAAPDAAAYSDAGADTLGHIAQWCAEKRNGNGGPLRLPNLADLGLGRACELATGRIPPGLTSRSAPQARFGCAAEQSKGKDTPSGHWEIAGVPVLFDWGYFPREVPCFPAELTSALCRAADLPGILGDRHASGTAIIAELGEEHIRTGKPICYTSADSVFQIAAHEETFGLERLYEICRVARTLVDAHRIGRVIARPFNGTSRDDFQRTANRLDYSAPPPAPTILDLATEEGHDVVSVGKIADIFAHSGTGREAKAHGNAALFDATVQNLASLSDGGLLFVNFIDFDTLYGHRRDPAGYAHALETFDARVPDLVQMLNPDDLLIITADHGCDPTWSGTDHTREQVPIIAVGGNTAHDIGRRSSFADIAATVAAHLELQPPCSGAAF
jgi:phosphopentomutase